MKTNVLIVLSIIWVALMFSMPADAQNPQAKLCKFRDGTEVVVMGKCPGASHFVRYVW
jgi:hypothetical protein